MKKLDLNKVVKFYRNDVRAGTYLIAKGFQREHKNVLRLVKKHIKRFETLGIVTERKFKSTGGRPVIEFLLIEALGEVVGRTIVPQSQIANQSKQLELFQGVTARNYCF